jgi:hypothetical protein
MRAACPTLRDLVASTIFGEELHGRYKQNLRYSLGIRLGLKKTTKNSVRITGLRAQILTRVSGIQSSSATYHGENFILLAGC